MFVKFGMGLLTCACLLLFAAVSSAQTVQPNISFGMKPSRSTPPEVVDMSWAKDGPYGPVEGKAIKVFILSGQSNMVGQGASRDLPVDLRRGDSRVLMFEEGRWQPLRPIGLTFGPEIAFAEAMAAAWPGETIGIVKQAENGTGVLAWHPQWSFEQAQRTGDGRKGNLWKALTEKLRTAMAAAPCELEGFIWMQGGDDMVRADLGREYLDNLVAVVKGVRDEFDMPELGFVLGSWRNGQPDDLSTVRDTFKPRRSGTFDVLQAHYEIQKVASPAKMVPLRDLELGPDGVHYNTNGQLELGRLLAEGYLELISNNNGE